MRFVVSPAENGRGTAARIGATVPGVNAWPEDWHPVNAEEAQEYIEAHQNSGGDAELLIECASFLPINPRTA
jgi:hypothetical protein